MIVKSHEADRYVASPPKGLTLALVYGPDAGLVQERAEKLLKSVVPDLTDPFNVSDLNESTLLADPARLADEAAAISMMGGRRVVRVRGAGNALAELLESFAADQVIRIPGGAARVVSGAGEWATTRAGCLRCGARLAVSSCVIGRSKPRVSTSVQRTSVQSAWTRNVGNVGVRLRHRRRDKRHR